MYDYSILFGYPHRVSPSAYLCAILIFDYLISCRLFTVVFEKISVPVNWNK